MPPVIGAAILGTVGAGSVAGLSVFGTSLTVGAIVGDVALTGALIGVEALIAATAGGIKTTVNIKQALAPRVRIYGRTMVSGAKAFEAVRNGNLYQAIMLASDQLDAVEAFYVGDTGVAVINNLVQSAPWGRSGGSSYIGFDVHLGAPDQAATGIIPSAFSETGNFQLAGIAYVGIVMLGAKAADFQKIYPQGQDTLFRFVVRGAQVYDPRDGSTRWSANAALCIRDFLTHKDGMNLPGFYIDDVSFSNFAGLCDQAVQLKAGGAEARYTINGTYDLSEEPKTVLARMCAACDGQLVQTAGPNGPVIGIRGGQFETPTVSITSDHILDAQFEQGAGAFDAYNRLTASFSFGLAYYQMTEISPLDDLASQAVVGDIPETFTLPMVTSYTQAARLAKIKMHKDNPAYRGSVSTDMSGLATAGETMVSVEYTPWGASAPLVSSSALVTSTTLKGDLSGVDLGLSTLTADAYAWDPATEEPDPPRNPFQISNYNNVDQPANAHATITLDAQMDGSTARIGHLMWDAADRTDAVPAAQFSLAAQNIWQAMTIGSDGQSATTPALAAMTAYDFEVAFTAGGATSSESVVAGVTSPS